MKKSFVVLLTCLLALPLLAQDNVEKAFLESPNGAMVHAETPFLFYPVPDQITRDHINLQFRIFVNGDAFGVESMTLKGITGGESVEFLSRNPDVLTYLNKAEAQGQTVEVEISFGDEKITLPLETLKILNLDLKKSPDFKPVAVTRHVALLMPEARKKVGENVGSYNATCQSDCFDDYEACAIANCGSPIVFCDGCLEDYADCLTNCCQASSTTFYRTTIVSYVYVGSSCLSYSWPSATSGTTYYTYRRNKKTERIRRSTDTYCVTTETVLSTTYSSDLCDLAVGIGCSPTVGKPTCGY